MLLPGTASPRTQGHCAASWYCITQGQDTGLLCCFLVLHHPVQSHCVASWYCITQYRVTVLLPGTASPRPQGYCAASWYCITQYRVTVLLPGTASSRPQGHCVASWYCITQYRVTVLLPDPRLSKPIKLCFCVFQMTLRDSQPVVFVKSYCSCVAGCGICNHLVALLYQTAHYSECGMSVVPPVLSCTETEQKWHKPRTMGVKPGPVDAMVVVKPKPDATPASRIRSTLYKGYSGELPDPSTLNPLPAYADMEPDSLPFICRMNITSDKPLVDSIFGKVQTGSILSYQHSPPPPDFRTFTRHRVIMSAPLSSPPTQTADLRKGITWQCSVQPWRSAAAVTMFRNSLKMLLTGGKANRKNRNGSRALSSLPPPSSLPPSLPVPSLHVPPSLPPLPPPTLSSLHPCPPSPLPPSSLPPSPLPPSLPPPSLPFLPPSLPSLPPSSSLPLPPCPSSSAPPYPPFLSSPPLPPPLALSSLPLQCPPSLPSLALSPSSMSRPPSLPSPPYPCPPSIHFPPSLPSPSLPPSLTSLRSLPPSLRPSSLALSSLPPCPPSPPSLPSLALPALLPCPPSLPPSLPP
ncbi:unnamed protein product [Coregonus sp. 'balchen']|nr:unnamed protein product [Coregonus sp. 'balchen']